MILPGWQLREDQDVPQRKIPSNARLPHPRIEICGDRYPVHLERPKTSLLDQDSRRLIEITPVTAVPTWVDADAPIPRGYLASPWLPPT